MVEACCPALHVDDFEFAAPNPFSATSHQRVSSLASSLQLQLSSTRQPTTTRRDAPGLFLSREDFGEGNSTHSAGRTSARRAVASSPTLGEQPSKLSLCKSNSRRLPAARQRSRLDRSEEGRLVRAYLPISQCLSGGKQKRVDDGGAPGQTAPQRTPSPCAATTSQSRSWAARGAQDGGRAGGH
jgi:hypothetical protein